MIDRWVVHAFLLVLTAHLGLCAASVAAHQPYQYTRKDLQVLASKANTPSEFQSLALYFRYRENVYREKAQAAIDDYSRCASNISISLKFVTRADSTLKLFKYYSFKADQAATNASKYEGLIKAKGLSPLNPYTVSFQSLSTEQPSFATGGGSLLEQHRSGNHPSSDTRER